jgi:two-component system, LytTR family, response regulator
MVYTKDIIRCEAEGSYSMFFMANGKRFMVTYGLIHYEELLSEKEFIRVHRHHLINIKYVERYDKEGFVIMKDGTKIEIARRKKDDFLNALKNV